MSIIADLGWFLGLLIIGSVLFIIALIINVICELFTKLKYLWFKVMLKVGQWFKVKSPMYNELQELLCKVAEHDSNEASAFIEFTKTGVKGS